MVNSTRAGANPLAVNTDAIGHAGDHQRRGDPVPGLGPRPARSPLVLPPDLARKLTVTTQQDNGVVLAQADLDQLIAHTDNGAVVLSGSARRIEIHTDNGDVITREPDLGVGIVQRHHR